MPKPPVQYESVYTQELLKEVLSERAVAAQRHEDLLARLAAQHELTKRLISELCNTPVVAKTDTVISSKARDLTEKVNNASATELAANFREDSETIPTPNTVTSIFRHLSDKSKLGVGTKKDIDETPTVRTRVRHIVKNHYFEAVFGILIVCNAITMCLEVQRRGLEVGCNLNFSKDCSIVESDGYKLWKGTHGVFEALDWTFGIVFTIEVALKVIALDATYFCDIWNVFDFVCVVVFLVDKVASAVLFVDSQVLRLFRLLRLIRLMRLMRMLESLDALYIMVTAIRGMTWVVFWAMMLLCLILTICALFLTILLHTSYFTEYADVASLSSEALQKEVAMYQYFGTFSRCFFSMFEITLANWPPVARMLHEEVSSVFIPICLIHKITVGFAVVGVINGCILQETFKVASIDDMIMVRQKKREQEMFQRKMSHLFEALDVVEDGELDFEEFTIIACHPDVQLWLASLDIDTDDMKTMFKLIDADGNGKISPNELITQMPRLRGTARNIDVMALCQHTIPHYVC